MYATALMEPSGNSWRILAASPVLVVDDVPASAAFFRDVLGFAVGFVTDQPHGFANVDRDGFEVHLVQASAPGARNSVAAASVHGSDLFFRVENVDAAYERMAAAGAETDGPPEDRVYEFRDFGVRDPNGYSLRFGQALPRGSS